LYYVTVAMNWIVRLAGLVVVILGLLFWFGRFLELLPLHMLLGLVLVAALWLIASLAILKGVMSAFGIFALGWGAAVIALGMTQDSLLLGDAHWIVKAVHLLVGISVIFLAQRLSKALQRTLRSGS
jgi:hypothetical protein